MWNHILSIFVEKKTLWWKSSALLLRDFFDKNSTRIVRQLPYSPNLVPCDFSLYSKLKRPMRERSFNTIEEIKTEQKKVLKALPEKYC